MKMGRRNFIALGITGLGSLSFMSLSACARPSRQVPDTEESATGVDDEVLEQAATDWQTALATAGETWGDLQDTIHDCESAIADFKTTVVTNPEVLAELESLCKEAKAFENQHTDMIMPAELTEIQNAIEDLERIASAYQQLIDEMYLCWNRIAIFDPFSGEFDIVDPVGYSYRIKYSVQAPVASVDTTLGKPSELAVMLSFPLAKVTVTNTTPGKQAPGPNELGSLILLYPDGQLSQARASVDDGSSDYFTSDTSGLEKALHFGGSIQSKAGLRYEYRYAETHGGYDFSRAFAVGESRERFDDAFSSSYFEDEESTYIIPEGAKDLLVDTLTKNIIGVAFANYSDIYGTVGSVEKNDAVCPDNVYYLSTPDHIN